METSNPKQAVVDKLKKSTNILVTVAHDPSVDALAAALGFTLMLNKMEKHATAVFSGVIPPAITFLEPEKTFEGTVDSLRDFIIALDKEKADRLRYKVEGDVVRIYITPYHTTITEKDLHYSQGDFNIDLVVALGVEKKADLDKAIVSHGRILHDASVITINTTTNESSLGSISWHDEKASSLCEMLLSVSESLKANVLDEQIATALLTGMVSATERFSNEHTSPNVMTLAAQLMAAGANQQLIAEKLAPESIPQPEPESAPAMQASTVEEASPTQAAPVTIADLEETVQANAEPPAPAMPQPNTDGLMQIEHDNVSQQQVAFDKDEYERSVANNQQLENALGHTQSSPFIQMPPTIPTSDAISTQQLSTDNANRQEVAFPEKNTQGSASTATLQQPESSSQPQNTPKLYDWRDNFRTLGLKPQEPREPILGGTLNATTSQAEKDKLVEEQSTFNHTILNHDASEESSDASAAQPPQHQPDPITSVDDNYTKGKTIQPVTMEPINSSAGLSYEETPFSESASSSSEPSHGRTIAELEAQVSALANKHPQTSSIENARQAVDTAIESQPLSVGGQNIPAVEPPTVDAIDVPTGPPAPVDMNAMPPMPDFSTLPPLPPAPNQDSATPTPSPNSPPPQPVQANQTPGQFQLPGQ